MTEAARSASLPIRGVRSGGDLASFTGSRLKARRHLCSSERASRSAAFRPSGQERCLQGRQGAPVNGHVLGMITGTWSSGLRTPPAERAVHAIRSHVPDPDSASTCVVCSRRWLAKQDHFACIPRLRQVIH
jgi:hypothetical protein